MRGHDAGIKLALKIHRPLWLLLKRPMARGKERTFKTGDKAFSIRQY